MFLGETRFSFSARATGRQLNRKCDALIVVMSGRRHGEFAAHHLQICCKCPKRILFTCYSACAALLSFEIKKRANFTNKKPRVLKKKTEEEEEDEEELGAFCLRPSDEFSAEACWESKVCDDSNRW